MKKGLALLVLISIFLAGCSSLHPERVQINGFDGVHTMIFDNHVKAVIELDWGMYIADDWRGCGCYDLSDAPHALDERFGAANYTSMECPRLVGGSGQSE